MKVIRVSNDDDWVALYIEGEAVQQNHSLDVGAVLEELSERGLIDYESYIVDNDWLLDQGWLPEEFSEIPEGVLE